MNKKKVLVVYYSRTGTTRKVAESIKSLLDSDIDEIADKKKRAGALGYLMAGRDATLKSLTEIEFNTNTKEYDLVIIGTPIWAFTMSTPIRTYITQNKDNLKNIAFFCTQGGSGSDRAFKEMEELCEKQPVAILELKTKEVVKDEAKEKIKDFVDKINSNN